jgi:hypothetical protein
MLRQACLPTRQAQQPKFVENVDGNIKEKMLNFGSAFDISEI